ncbi:helix-turn-helix transcriptional regulator [Novosphingobium sp. KA1]|uniref:helix-turn-helix domain-containing protein n=1 Tax=Novosphingobium sp. (strain KA1) TaxID=164608 RepID=UPI001A8E9A71|nr:helix-turn-helix transcriptional regulator [Novosphingobium sp. KA1]QSR19006.1 XRE family transcriptional regulator [Novosphingobium sp. KA1]
MDKPSPRELREATGISQSYASMIASGVRPPSRPLAIHIFRRTGWKPEIISDLTDEQIAMLEQVEPWTPRQDAAA